MGSTPTPGTIVLKPFSESPDYVNQPAVLNFCAQFRAQGIAGLGRSSLLSLEGSIYRFTTLDYVRFIGVSLADMARGVIGIP